MTIPGLARAIPTLLALAALLSCATLGVARPAKAAAPSLPERPILPAREQPADQTALPTSPATSLPATSPTSTADSGATLTPTPTPTLKTSPAPDSASTPAREPGSTAPKTSDPAAMAIASPAITPTAVPRPAPMEAPPSEAAAPTARPEVALALPSPPTRADEALRNPRGTDGVGLSPEPKSLPDETAASFKSAAMTVPTWSARTIAAIERSRVGGISTFLLRKETGRLRGAVLIALPKWATGETPGREGIAALALALALYGTAGREETEGPASGQASGQSGKPQIGIVELAGMSLGILVEDGNDELNEDLRVIFSAFEAPVFLNGDFGDEAFQAVLRRLREAERRRRAEGRSGLVAALGNETGLRTASLEEARAFWKRRYRRTDMDLLASGDLDAARIAASIGDTATAGPAPTGEAGGNPGSSRVSLDLPSHVGELAGIEQLGNKAIGLRVRIPLGAMGGVPRAAWALLFEALRGSEPAAGFDRSNELYEYSVDRWGISAIMGEGKADLPFAGTGALLAAFVKPGGPGPRQEGTSQGAALATLRTRTLEAFYENGGRSGLLIAMADDLIQGGDGMDPLRFAAELQSVNEAQVAAAALSFADLLAAHAKKR